MNMDANLKLLYATDAGSYYTADTIDAGEPFDVIANVEIGEGLFGFVDKHELFVSVLNVSKSKTVLEKVHVENLTPENKAYRAEVTVKLTDPWTAESGDILQVVATYKVTAGATTDYSHDESDRFIVV